MTRLLGLIQHPSFGPGLLILGSCLLPLLITRSELFIGIAVLGVGVGIWTWRVPSRWLTTLSALFVWSILALALRSLELWGYPVALVAFYLATVLVVLWHVTHLTLESMVTAQALAIGLAEVFLILLFWPINFPSRALLLVIIGALGLEVIQRVGQGGRLTLRQLWPSLTLATVVMIGVVVTADWFGF